MKMCGKLPKSVKKFRDDFAIYLFPFSFSLSESAKKTGRPRFGSVRLRFGDGAVQAVPVFGSGGSSAKGFFSVFLYSLTGKEGSGSGFGSRKTVPAVPVPLSVSGKTVPTVPVSGSGSVPEPP